MKKKIFISVITILLLIIATLLIVNIIKYKKSKINSNTQEISTRFNDDELFTKDLEPPTTTEQRTRETEFVDNSPRVIDVDY